ncbi:phage protein [Streptococcus equi subsp. equi]|uniref:hypothetical protein n=1 Tax=Streptococcus equi TaxID=1336 RepID=UPI00065951A6|nr:hypothetical protein [Streptococcus equi]CRW66423.1 phage protein [Streptococcus equi subsp. equi]
MAEVIKTFRDKETTNTYYVGDDYNGDRIDELTAKGYLSGDKVSAAAIEIDLDKLKVDEIRAKLDELGVAHDPKLKKARIIRTFETVS